MRKYIAKRLLAFAVAIAVTCITAQAKNITFQKINLVSDLSNVAQIQDTNLVDAWGISAGTYFTFSTTDFTTNRITNYYSLTTNLVIQKHKTNIVVTTNFSLFTTITNVLPASITNSFFWIAANQRPSTNDTFKALVYAVTNAEVTNPIVIKQPLEVTIPGAFPSGLVANDFRVINTNSFTTNNFFFVTEDGTISGWSAISNFLPNVAVELTNRTTAVYKGIALVTTVSNGPVILAANFSEGTVDMYAATNTITATNLLGTTNVIGTTGMSLIGQFADPKAPVGYAPFNIQNVDGVVLVTFAKQDALKIDDVAGPGNGLIDIFNPDVQKFYRFATGTGAGGKEANLNSPYGLALTPSSWGNLANMLLVANFGDGTITVFNDNGKSKAKLQDANAQNIVIPEIWGLTFGIGGTAGDPNDLYFTAGLNGESNGLFGVLMPPPSKSKKTK